MMESMGIFSWFVMIIVWGLAIAGSIAIARSFTRSSSNANKLLLERPPLELLQERYVKGEINLTEYEQKKSILEG